MSSIKPCRSPASRIFVVAFLAASLCRGQTNGPNASAASSSNPTPATRIALASNSGPPGSEVVIPIYFTPASAVEAGKLKLEISFVSVNLKFEGVERGLAAKIPNLDFTSNVLAGKNAKGVETSTVTVLASLSSTAGRTKGIPSGILGYLKLRIKETANPAIIALRTKAEGTLLGSNAPLSNVQAADGQVEISWVDAPPSVTCFFFTH